MDSSCKQRGAQAGGRIAAPCGPRSPHPGPDAYAELHCLTNYTFLRGASHPEELVERAHALGYRALAITDECSLSGVVRAHLKAKDLSLPLIIGCELRLQDGPRCGKCGEALFGGSVLELSAATFQRHLERGDLPLLVDAARAEGRQVAVQVAGVQGRGQPDHQVQRPRLVLVDPLPFDLCPHPVLEVGNDPHAFTWDPVAGNAVFPLERFGPVTITDCPPGAPCEVSAPMPMAYSTFPASTRE